MTDLEIPFEKDRHGHYRFFEILPGALSWLLIFLPLILTFVSVTLAVVAILCYLLIYFVRSVAYSIRAIAGYRAMKQQLKLDWNALNADIDAGQPVGSAGTFRPKWHYKNLRLLPTRALPLQPSQLTHAVIVATYQESREVLEPTIQAIAGADYDPQRIILVIAYEGRAGQAAEDRVNELIQLYGPQFRHAMAVKHPPNLPGEVIGKGGNITYAARHLKTYLETEQADMSRVLVTTLDADNRPDARYFAALSYLYCVVPKPLRASYQPLPMFTNNIWDAPMLMRVIATGNNLFYIVGSQRPHMARNFSSHAQPMQSLIDTDFWSRRTIVEDGHQFWRSYFRYEGDYRVYPLNIPIYQDAVLADGYIRTLKAQFIQLRRWTYGVSDVAYIADKGFYHKNTIPKADVLAKLLRTLEGHVTWATGPLLIYFAAFIPPFFKPQNLAANELPLIVSRVQRIGIAGLLVSLYICLITLPPRPARYKRHHSVFMVLQWVLLPVTSVAYGCFAAFNSQTRLMFKRYLTKFDATEKAVKTDSPVQRPVNSRAALPRIAPVPAAAHTAAPQRTITSVPRPRPARPAASGQDMLHTPAPRSVIVPGRPLSKPTVPQPLPPRPIAVRLPISEPPSSPAKPSISIAVDEIIDVPAPSEPMPKRRAAIRRPKKAAARPAAKAKPAARKTAAKKPIAVAPKKTAAKPAASRKTVTPKPVAVKPVAKIPPKAAAKTKSVPKKPSKPAAKQAKIIQPAAKKSPKAAPSTSSTAKPARKTAKAPAKQSKTKK